ncbi:MAG: lysostaphin resistance A-like protein, partial [Candidatus Dormibacteria bacterium]
RAHRGAHSVASTRTGPPSRTPSMIALLMLALLAATAMRVLIGGANVASSLPAALAFSALALITVITARSRVFVRSAGPVDAGTADLAAAAGTTGVDAARRGARVTTRAVNNHVIRDVAVGSAGAALILGAWLSAGAPLPLHATRHLVALAWWTPVVIAVAITEEALLRGALFSALTRRYNAYVALLITSLVFGVMHVPLYGWAAVPLDVTGGVLLGGLRMLTGGVAAPAVAHALTDVAAGWLG